MNHSGASLGALGSAILTWCALNNFRHIVLDVLTILSADNVLENIEAVLSVGIKNAGLSLPSMPKRTGPRLSMASACAVPSSL